MFSARLDLRRMRRVHDEARALKVPRAHTGLRPTLGWREWVRLPELGIGLIKAKVDTGARTSSLHAFDVEEFRAGKKRMVRFKVHPEQRNSKYTVTTKAPVCDWRKVRSSSGVAELRPVVLTMLEVLGVRYEVELTLTNRDEMGFRMLLGRQATRRRFLVDPGASYLNGRRLKGERRLSKRTVRRKPKRGNHP